MISKKDDTSSVAPDAYAIRGELVDDMPKGRKVGYVTMRDGSVIECYVKFNPAVIIVPLIIIALAIIGVVVYLVFLQPKDVSINAGSSDLILKTGNDNNIVQYNGFMVLKDGKVSVNFTNGDYPCTIQLVGEGINCDPVQVAPEEFVASIPATFTTTSGVVDAQLVITTETSTTTENVVTEIPENNTDDSIDTGLEGYWKGECIYGTSVN